MMPNNETEHTEMQTSPEHEQNYEIIILAPNGLGFGEGTISTTTQIENGELSPEALQIGGEIILTDQDVFVKIDDDANDDGCGDGRPAARVFKRNIVTGEEMEFKLSRRRAKVFGGGLAVASSMYRTALGVPTLPGETVFNDRVHVADLLAQNGIEHGAHTDSHAHGEACGCGAIDKYPQVTINAVVFKNEIIATLHALYGDSYDDNAAAIERAFDVYESLAADNKYFSDAAGSKTMNLLLDRESIIKELGGSHLEDFVVMNDVPNTTFDQRTFDAKLKERGVDTEAQSFVVDTWRGRMYAQKVAEFISQEGETGLTREEIEKVCYADFLIRTLAVSATLTAGDLPVYGRPNSGRAGFGYLDASLPS